MPGIGRQRTSSSVLFVCSCANKPIPKVVGMKSVRAFAVAVFAFLGARAAPPPSVAAVDLGGGVTMDFVLVPAGSFLMGSDENTGDGDEWPVHRVTFSRPLYVARYEVTQEQWGKVMGANPSRFRGARRPVDTVSWNDAQVFLARLRTRTGRVLRLPTEAEWEYACRAGSAAPWSFGEREAIAPEFAWLGENSGGTTHAVGTRQPNAWGVCDMHGNVWEWCADAYVKHAYPDSGVVDPPGPPPAEGRVLRGGAWGDTPYNARSAARNCLGPD